MRTDAIFLRPCVSGMTMVAVGRVWQRMYPMISVGHHGRVGRSGVSWIGSTRTGRIAVGIRQRHGSDAGRGPTLAAAASNVLSIAGGHLLTLVPSEFDRLSQLSRHRSAVSTLPQQRVDCLYLVPTYKQPASFYTQTFVGSLYILWTRNYYYYYYDYDDDDVDDDYDHDHYHYYYYDYDYYYLQFLLNWPNFPE